MSIDHERLAAEVVAGTQALMAKEVAPLRKRRAELEAAQAKGVRYRGSWAGAAETYAHGDLVTRSGSLWHCNFGGTKDTPGTGAAWTMMHKSEAGR